MCFSWLLITPQFPVQFVHLEGSPEYPFHRSQAPVGLVRISGVQPISLDYVRHHWCLMVSQLMIEKRNQKEFSTQMNKRLGLHTFLWYSDEEYFLIPGDVCIDMHRIHELLLYIDYTLPPSFIPMTAVERAGGGLGPLSPVNNPPPPRSEIVFEPKPTGSPAVNAKGCKKHQLCKPPSLQL